ncbi:MAG: agmatine deiminase family protein, partial [Allosphingosinicella sp.]
MSSFPRQPPEWAPHASVWIGFPSHADLWLDDLEPARAEVAAFAEAVWAGGKGEEVRLVAADPDSAQAALSNAPFATIVEEPFGDIWLRDTGPILLGDGSRKFARSFRFNGWGGKFRLEGDDTIGLRLARGIGLEGERRDWILEGGAIDVDGTGLAVTTEQCLLNPNRNPGMSREEVE